MPEGKGEGAPEEGARFAAFGAAAGFGIGGALGRSARVGETGREHTGESGGVRKTGVGSRVERAGPRVSPLKSSVGRLLDFRRERDILGAIEAV